MVAYFSLPFLLAIWGVIVRGMVSRVAGGRSTKEGQFLIVRVKVESRQVALSHISPKLKHESDRSLSPLTASSLSFLPRSIEHSRSCQRSKSSVLRQWKSSSAGTWVARDQLISSLFIHFSISCFFVSFSYSFLICKFDSLSFFTWCSNIAERNSWSPVTRSASLIMISLTVAQGRASRLCFSQTARICWYLMLRDWIWSWI